MGAVAHMPFTPVLETDTLALFSKRKFEIIQGSAMALVEQLKGVVDGYFEKYPHMSINALAQRSGVPATTLRRIINKTVKGDPAPHTVLNIISAVY